MTARLYRSIQAGNRARERMQKRGKSYRIAQCGMATTLAVIVLAFGHVLTMGEFFWYFVASLLVDVPERMADKALCVLATSILSVLLCGFNYVYLASFGLLMAPYVLVKAVTRTCPPMVQYIAVAVASFLGMLGICWWTPMFIVQLSIVTTTWVRWAATVVILLVSLLFEPLYGRLYRFCKQILLKVWYRFA